MKQLLLLLFLVSNLFSFHTRVDSLWVYKAIKFMDPSFDSLLYIDADDSTLKNTGIYYNRVSQYTYFPTGIVIDTLNSEAAITVRSPNSTEYPSIPLKLYPASTNENVGHVIINPMLQDTFYNGSWLNRISTGGVSIGGQLYGETRKSEMIVGAEGFYFINRFYHADENDGCIHIDNSHNLYITDTTGVNLGLSLAVGGSPNPTRGISLGEDGSHIYDSLFLHGIKEDLTSDTVDILFMKHGYEVKKRSLADFADTIIKIIEATDTVYVDSARAAWKADTLIYLSDSLDVVRSLISAASDSVEKSHHSVYSDTADTAFVAGVADSAKNVSDTVAAHINGTLRYVAAFTDATHLGNSTMHFTSPSMGVLDYSSGSIQAMSIGLTATCAADSLYGNKSCFYFSPKLRHPDTVSSFDMVSVVDDSVVKVVSSSTFRTQIGAQAAISVTDNYVVKGNGTGALQPGIIYDDGTNVGIGTSSPAANLQIAGIPSNAFGIIAGNDVKGGGMTDDTRKYLRIGCPSYDIDEEPVSIITVDNNGSANILRIGGGTSVGNAPTEINFSTAALNTTTGTLRMIIDSDGKVGIGTGAPLTDVEIRPATDETVKLTITGDKSISAVGDEFCSLDFRSGGDTSPGSDNDITARIVSVSESGTGAQAGIAVYTCGLEGSSYLSERVRITSGGSVGIGTETPTARLDVCEGGDDDRISLVVGADANASSRTDGNNKYARIGCPHYDLDEEVSAILYCSNTSTENRLRWGGGSSSMNSATSHQFYTSASNTITTGTERVRIESDGKVAIGLTAPATAVLDINSDIIRLRTAKTPANSTAAGNAGDICWDTNYLYVCYATNSWGRIALGKTGW